MASGRDLVSVPKLACGRLSSDGCVWVSMSRLAHGGLACGELARGRLACPG